MERLRQALIREQEAKQLQASLERMRAEGRLSAQEADRLAVQYADQLNTARVATETIRAEVRQQIAELERQMAEHDNALADVEVRATVGEITADVHLERRRVLQEQRRILESQVAFLRPLLEAVVPEQVPTTQIPPSPRPAPGPQPFTPGVPAWSPPVPAGPIPAWAMSVLSALASLGKPLASIAPQARQVTIGAGALMLLSALAFPAFTMSDPLGIASISWQIMNCGIWGVLALAAGAVAVAGGLVRQDWQRPILAAGGGLVGLLIGVILMLVRGPVGGLLGDLVREAVKPTWGFYIYLVACLGAIVGGAAQTWSGARRQ